MLSLGRLVVVVISTFVEPVASSTNSIDELGLFGVGFHFLAQAKNMGPNDTFGFKFSNLIAPGLCYQILPRQDLAWMLHQAG